MEGQLDKTYYEGILGSGAITPEVLAEMDAQANRLVDELAQANAEISALKRTAVRASAAIAERDATIERLRAALTSLLPLAEEAADAKPHFSQRVECRKIINAAESALKVTP